MNISEIVADFLRSNEDQIKLSKKEVYQSIEALFPLRISVAPEFKHTENEQRKNLHTAPRPWHYEEILEKMESHIQIKYIHNENSYLFSRISSV